MLKNFSPTLAIYLGRRYLASVFFTTMMLSAFVFLLDFIEITRRLGSKPDIGGDIAMRLVFLKMPDMMLQIAPFAILIGTMISFAKLSKDHELIAIRASGMPARQFLLPPLFVCLAIGIFNLTVVNPFSAATLKSHQKIESEIFPGSAQGMVTKGGSIWLKQRDLGKDYIIYARTVGAKGDTLENTTVFMFNYDGSFAQRIDTPLMTVNKGKWTLHTPLILRTGQPSERLDSMVLRTSLTPEMIRNSFTSPRTLSIWELQDFIRLLKETGFPTQTHEMHQQKLFASPALNLALFLIGAPFALRFSRNRSLASMILMGLGFGFVFRMFIDLVGTYGMAGQLNIVLAAWFPTAIASLLGLSLFLHFREE